MAPVDENVVDVVDKSVIGALVRSASDMLAENGDGENHTVAASIYTAEGLVFTGMNLYHFTGGPCAEVVALSRLISDGGGAPVAVVAVGDSGRGVLAPCGRCRQVLADYCPDIRVILPAEGGLSAKPLSELIPYAYIWAKQQ